MLQFKESQDHKSVLFLLRRSSPAWRSL